MTLADPARDHAAGLIIEAGRRMDRFGWVPATAGNISVRLPGAGVLDGPSPRAVPGSGRIAITRSGGHKGFLAPDGIMVVDLQGRPEDPAARPSAETGLHCGIYRRFPEAGAVLHGHSVPVTVLSRRAGDTVPLSGYELLKAFPGLATHDASIALPVFDNDQDIDRLQRAVEARWQALEGMPPPGYLIRGHGIYVWGADMPQALMRLEALEFMLACALAEAGGHMEGIA